MADTTLHFDHALLPTGWAADVRLTITSGRIASVETGVSSNHRDARHAVALPGMPNLHSHAFQRAMAGLAEVRGTSDDTFWTWREAMYRFVERITPEDLTAIAAMAQVEMLESGFTRVGEFHYLHHAPDGSAYADPAEMGAALARAADETGIGLTLLPVFYAHSGFGGSAPGEGQRRFVTDLDGFAHLLDASERAVASLPDAVVGVAPHSLRAVTPEALSTLAAMRPAAPIHIHIAEQLREVEDCVAWSGQRPVEWLFDHNDVDRRWCLVHATHVEPGELAGIAASGAVVGLCPITEANLGDGIFPARAFWDAGGQFGVGSDSNVLIDMAEELRLLEYGQRLTQHGRNILAASGASTGTTLFGASVSGGAQALGVAGGISVGASADLISLDPDHIAMTGRTRDGWIDALIFAGGRAAIDRVWRHGASVVESGRHRARGAVEARYRKTLTRLLG
ncbi:formimidoylglutamate deiminase [Sphingomonas sp. AX6]|uniref:formimidoylglutamate deiminase n=1 Tax=Sphingomonas sp. AX6 TaxID=2653171 RepID=UPI0012EF6326|nr:formimidoylglutamate deiminase [Sphingomonas sp. AX6]VXC87030.1 Formiminoglutamic iminohydrolase [Sphingomonas sp. AX6]